MTLQEEFDKLQAEHRDLKESLRVAMGYMTPNQLKDMSNRHLYVGTESITPKTSNKPYLVYRAQLIDTLIKDLASMADSISLQMRGEDASTIKDVLSIRVGQMVRERSLSEVDLPWDYAFKVEESGGVVSIRYRTSKGVLMCLWKKRINGGQG